MQPTTQGLACWNLLRLFALTGETRFRDRAFHVIRTLFPPPLQPLDSVDPFFALVGSSLDASGGSGALPTAVLTLTGRRPTSTANAVAEDASVDAFLYASRARYRPTSVTRFVESPSTAVAMRASVPLAEAFWEVAVRDRRTTGFVLGPSGSVSGPFASVSDFAAECGTLR